MKKIYKLLFILFLFLCVPKFAFAISVEEFYGTYGDGNSDAYSNNINESYSNHIVHIENLYFNDYLMNVTGYAFMPHQDNYGGPGGNIKTYFVAFDGSSTWKEWSRKYISLDDVNGTISCINDNNCYLKEVTVKERDFWGARCTGNGCANQKVITDYRVQKGFNNTVTCSTETVSINGRDYDSDCLYYNVGFSVELNLNSVLDNLVVDASYIDNMQSTSIGFMVVTINTDVLINKKPGVGIGYTEIYVPNDVCRYKNQDGKSVKCSDDEIITNSFHFNYKSSQNQVGLNVRFAPPLVKNNLGDFNEFGEDYYFYNIGFDGFFTNYEDIKEQGLIRWFVGTVYNFSDYYSEVVERNRKVNGVSVTPFKDTLYRLDTYNENKCNDIVAGSIGKKGMFGLDLSCAVANYKDYSGNYASDNQEYWAYSNWIKTQGSFRITGIKRNTIKVMCNSIGYNEDIKYLNNDNDSSVTCNNESDNAVTIEQCSDNNDNGYEVSGTIYIKDNNYNDSSCGINTFIDDGYVPINITTRVLLHQKGYFRFNKINDDVIRAGKGFEIISSIGSNNNTLIYNALLEWSYSLWKKYSGRTVPYYVADANYYGDSCSALDIYDILENNSGKIYYEINGSPLSLEDAIFNAIDISVQNQFYKVDTMTDLNNSDSYNKNVSAFSTDVLVESCNSNSNANYCDRKVSIEGKWLLGKVSAGLRYLLFGNNEDNVSFEQTAVPNSIQSGRGSYFEYFYSLPNAYISLIDNGTYNYSDVLYIDGLIDNSKKDKFYYVGNKYFVPLKYSNSSFPFNLANDVNPSLMNIMEWELNGSCSVDVENGLFDNYGKPLYKYRSISLSTPFPKVDAATGVGYPINWSEWMSGSNKDNNIARLNNTHDVGNARKYSITIGKLDGIDNTTSVMDINEYSNDKFYGDITNFQDTKYSKFVRDYFNDMASNETYCGLGFFSSSCDTLR